MPRPLPFLTTRAATWGASLAIHAGLAVAGSHAFRGTASSDAGPAEAIDVDVTWEAPHLPPPVLEESVGTNMTAPLAMHTHPYPVPPGHDAHPHDPALVHAPAAVEALAKPAPAPVAAPAMAEVVGAKEPAMPTFVLSTASAFAAPADVRAAAMQGATGVSGATAGGSAEGDGAILAESAVDVPARVLDEGPPLAYPERASAAGIEGEVLVEIVVDERGTVTASRLLVQKGYGLDEAALRAVQRMRFSPAIRAGRAVRVRMRKPMIFRLR